MRREMCLSGTRCLKTMKRKDLNRPHLLPRRKGGNPNELQRRKRKRLLKQKELKKHHSELQEAQVEKWLESTGRFPKKRWKIEQKRTLKIWFEGMDKDKSGEIDVDELADPLMSTGLAHTMSEVSNLVSCIDADKSSGIDFQEFLDVLKKDDETNNNTQRAQTSKNTSTLSDLVREKKFAESGYRRKKQKKATTRTHPIVEFTKRQHSEHMDLKSVLSHERRKLLLDATMVQAERREKAIEQINRWRLEMKNLAGASRFRKLHDISTLIHRLEIDKAEKESFVCAMKGMIEKIQKEDSNTPKQRDGRYASTPAHQALLKKRNVSMLSRDKGRLSIGSPRKALVYPRTRNPSLPSLLGITHRRGI